MTAVPALEAPVIDQILRLTWHLFWWGTMLLMALTDILGQRSQKAS